MKKNHQENGSVIICAVLTLLIVSVIGAAVLFNCTTRYNTTSKQVKAWNEALYAAEAGADVGFAECRKVISLGSTFSGTFPGDGWSVAATPTPGPAYSKGPIYLGQNNSLKANVTVDKFTSTAGFDCYRIRSVGTATLYGLARTGMDDKLLGAADTTSHFSTSGATRGSGDSLLRKIDFTYDHFLATYGDGDGNSKAIQTVSNPQVTRRVETIVVPQWAFTGAIKATGSFDGPGSAGVVDSYDSKQGMYGAGTQLASDGTSGDVSVATANFIEGGPIYGNVTTNGANITHSNTSISGTIDNNVPFSLPNLLKPDTTGYTSASGSTLNLPQPASASAAGTSVGNPLTYVYSGSVSNLTINGQTVGSGVNAGKPEEIYVKIVVNGDVTGGITIGRGVNAQVYFTGNLSMKAKDESNNNVDGATGQYTWSGVASTDYSRAGHMQFYGISPTNGSNNSITIDPPGTMYATFYAPSDNISINGNVQIDGALVAHNFSGNGNTGFHYDKELAALGGIPIDYQVASYIEDIR